MQGSRALETARRVPGEGEKDVLGRLARDPAFRMSAAYVLAGALWIIGSDSLVGALPFSSVFGFDVQTLKGWVFILVTGGLFYLVAHHIFRARERAEEAVRDSEARYRLLAEHSSDIIWTSDLDLQHVYVSPAVERVLGYRPCEVEALGLPAILTPGAEQLARGVIAGALRRCAEDGAPAVPVTLELDLRHRDGSTRRAEVRAVFVRGPEARPYTLVGVARDVTERHRMQLRYEQELRARATHLQLLSRATAIAHQADAPEEAWPGVLELLCRDAGWAVGAVLVPEAGGEPHLVATPVIYAEDPARWEGLTQAWQEARWEACTGVAGRTLRTAEPQWFSATALTAPEYPLVGELIRAGLRAACTFPVLVGGGVTAVFLLGSCDERPLDPAFLEVLRDIGIQLGRVVERARARRAVEESEELHRSLLEGARLGAYRTDGRPEGHMVWANEALLALYGYDSLDELVSVPASSLYAAAEQRDALLEELRRTGEIRGREVRLRRRDGAVIHAAISAVAHFGPNGELLWTDGVVEDITERLRAAEEQRSLQTQLERTQRLESLGVLASGIAHDFNNILAAMLGFTEMTADSLPEGSPERTNLDHVMAAGARASDLVSQILAFARQGEQQSRPLNLKTILGEVAQFLRSSLPTTIRISRDIAANTGLVIADPTSIHQIVMNLCTNARQAMPDGGELGIRLDEVTVDESLAPPLRGLPPGRYARIAISDSGCGMDRETIERIFEPFFTTKPPGEGTGLGLATVHGIVQRHGGAVTVDSEPGVGTTFHVYLPCVPGVEVPEVPAAEPPPTGTERILLVDDDRSVLLLAREMLRSLGYSVRAVESSTEALELIGGDPGLCDILVTDQTMPGMLGTQLAERARRIRPDLPVLLMTGFSGQVDPAAAAAAGVTTVLLKPYNLRQLAEAVRTAVARTE